VIRVHKEPGNARISKTQQTYFVKAVLLQKQHVTDYYDNFMNLIARHYCDTESLNNEYNRKKEMH